MKIAVVILNWNGKKLLEQFLPSVVHHSVGADIYVADNASTDDSIVFVEKNFPSVRIIQNKANGGFSKGYNDALRHLKADVFCLLNSDVEVTENWLSPIEDSFRSSQNVAIIQPKILDFNRKDHFEYAGAGGGFIDKFGYPYCRGRIFNTVERDSGQYNDTIPIFWASGACLFIRRSVYEELKGLDETFFAHMEEIDLCWRARNRGYDIQYVGNSTVYHIGGATLNNLNPKKTYLNFRNSLYTLVKNAKGNVFMLVLIRLLLDGVAGMKFLLEFKFAHIIAIIKAHLMFYGHLPLLLKQRKAVPKKIKYYQCTSIVWDYFVNRKRVYKSL
ncbi:glycosyltransferase family 2 protein [Hyunsoonleella sp. SJ7]|uniref:Glycosyltransferase family 2 protein n=1 Tax=Hyunsoonleella aquatilis TaxID=2762758 RepID=A0A923HAM4_9FLAO|nr:glycosyltransferase family 2 protein [Hyunsoonleella aquatilis]MBC3758869.1 glycosyltransferase family 2 protein [Hyunsoonleella aquatilis]